MSEAPQAMTTHITYVLDSSGSMGSIKQDTIGGFNEFLADQQGEPGDASVSLYEFNTSVEQVYHGKDINAADQLDEETYTPGGRTALYDAIVRAIADTDKYVTTADADIENVVVVVLTDGRENASETPQDAVQERVETRRSKDDWEFLFIGANQDAALTAERMGMDAGKSLDMAHSGEGTQAANTSTSRQVSQVRRTGSTSGYDEEDRRRQRQEKKRPDDPSGNEDHTGEIDSHPSVIAIPGAPPWFSCQRCGAYRSTHAGLRDLPCEPGRYDDVSFGDRVTVGDVEHARIDQALRTEDGNLHILAHTVETGVRVEFETEFEDLARGDEVGVRIERINGEIQGQFEQVVSREDRVGSPPTVDDGGDDE